MVDTWVDWSYQLLWIMLLRKFVYRSSCGYYLSLLLDKYIGEKLLGHMVSAFNFRRIWWNVFQRGGVNGCSHERWAWWFQSLHSLSNTYCYQSLIIGHNNESSVASHNGFNLHFANINNWASFYLLICHMYPFFGKVST